MPSQNCETARAGTPAALEKVVLIDLPDKPALPGRQDRLAAALDYARRGWPIFPCRWEDEPDDAFQRRKATAPPEARVKRNMAKSPLVGGGFRDATTAPEQIIEWWTRWPLAMIGLPTGAASSLWALDVDTPKQEGAPDGRASLTRLEAEHGPLPETLEQRTGSGGQHLIFQWPADGREVRNSARKIGRGLDVRGEGGYVILPPSGHPCGGSYEWVNMPGEVEIAEAPAWLLELVARKPEKKPVDTCAPAVELDQPDIILESVDWLQAHAPLAIEGQGGDATTFKVAAELRGRGVSEDTALSLMLRFWNSRCEPAWEQDELAVKVGNAFRYANQERPGENTAEAAFNDELSRIIAMALSEPSAPEPRSSPGAFQFLSLQQIMAAPRPTRWLIRGFLEAGSLAVLFGEAGSMKSFLAIDQGLCIASGLPWHGHACPNPGAVFYLAGEGFDGLTKRIRAWTVAHNVELAPFFLSRAPAQLLDKTHARAVCDAIGALAEQHGVPRLVIIDTLNRNFGDGDENSSQDMTAFVAALDRLKARFGCAVLVVHHSGIAAKDRSRGSSVLRAAADYEYKLEKKESLRIFSNTKTKDHEPPEKLAFTPEDVGTGWHDPETGCELSSCVLRVADTVKCCGPARPTGAKGIALEALEAVHARDGGPVHIDVWRAEAYARGISTGGASAKRTALRRAVEQLRDSGHALAVGEDLWSPYGFGSETCGT